MWTALHVLAITVAATLAVTPNSVDGAQPSAPTHYIVVVAPSLALRVRPLPLPPCDAPRDVSLPSVIWRG